MSDWVPIEDLRKHQRKEKIKSVFTRIKRGLTPPQTPKHGGQKKGKSGFDKFLDFAEGASKNMGTVDNPFDYQGPPQRKKGGKSNLCKRCGWDKSMCQCVW